MAQITFSGSIGVPGSQSVLGNINIIIGNANHTLLASEYSNKFLDITSSVSLTSTYNIVAPLNQGQEFTVQNNTTGGYSVQIIGASGAGVTISNGGTVSVVCDGTNYLQSSGGSSSSPTATIDSTSAAVSLGDPLTSVANGNLVKATQATLAASGTGVVAWAAVAAASPPATIAIYPNTPGVKIPASAFGLGAGLATDAIITGSPLRLARASTVVASGIHYGNILGPDVIGKVDASGNFYPSDQPATATSPSYSFNPRMMIYGLATGNGSTDDGYALVACDLAAAAAGRHAVLSAGSYAVAHNITLTAPWAFEEGAILQPATGFTITLNKEPRAHWDQKIFEQGLSVTHDATGGGITMSQNSTVHPGWWGSLYNGIVSDGPPIQQAVLSLPLGGTVQLPTGTAYTAISSIPYTILIPYGGITIAGKGRNATSLSGGAGCTIFISPIPPLVSSYDGYAYFSSDIALPDPTITNPCSFHFDGSTGKFWSTSEDMHDSWGDAEGPGLVRYYPYLTADFFYKPTDITLDAAIFSSVGAMRYSLADQAVAFHVEQANSGIIRAGFTLNSTGDHTGTVISGLSTAVLVTTSNVLTVGHWHHITAQFDGTTIKIFVY